MQLHPDSQVKLIKLVLMCLPFFYWACITVPTDKKAVTKNILCRVKEQDIRIICPFFLPFPSPPPHWPT